MKSQRKSELDATLKHTRKSSIRLILVSSLCMYVHVMMCFYHQVHPPRAPVTAITLPASFHVPRQDIAFIERKSELETLQKEFESGHKAVSVYAGMGGVGKTQLALRYTLSTTNYDLKAWFQAEKVSTLEQDFLDFANQFQCPGNLTSPDQVRAAVLSWLQNVNFQWLLVFDNANQYDEIQRFLPYLGAESKGHILVTTRKQKWPHNSFRMIPISVMSESEAVQLIQTVSQRKRDDEIEDAKELAKQVGYLPLALSQASAYICMRQPMTIREYIDLFKSDAAKLLASANYPEGDDYSVAVAVTWNRSVEAVVQSVQKNNAPIDAVHSILYACSYVDADNIPDSFLLSFVESQVKITKGDFNLIKNVLHDYSLITFKDYGSAMISVHRLVQTVLRHRHHPSLSIEWYGHLMTAAHNRFIPTSDDVKQQERNFGSLFPHLQMLLQHHDIIWPEHDQHTALAAVLHDIGFVLSQLGEYAKQKQLFERALKIKEAHYGADHSSTNISLANLSTAYLSLGEYEKAKQLLERVLIIRETHYGADHPQTGLALINLGGAYGSLGDYEKQKQLLERALKISETHYGADHPQTGITLTNLGTAYLSLGEFEKAKQLLERALKIKVIHYGADHPSTGVTLGNLSNAYDSLGEHEKAKQLLERALKIFETHYGADHPSTGATLSHLSVAYGDLGDYQKQKQLLERALRISASRNVSGHQWALVAQRELAAIKVSSATVPGSIESKIEKGLELKQKGNELFQSGEYQKALNRYTHGTKPTHKHPPMKSKPPSHPRQRSDPFHSFQIILLR